jgi:hypothetical protein
VEAAAEQRKKKRDLGVRGNLGLRIKKGGGLASVGVKVVV